MSLGDVRDGLTQRRAPTHYALPMELAVLIIGAALLSLLFSVLASRSLAVIGTQSQWLAHTERVRVELGRVFELMLRVENAAGRYVLSQDQGFLADYKNARTEIPATLERLEQLVASDAAQNSLATALETKSREYLALTDRVLQETGRGNLAGARSLLAGPAGQEVMNGVRSLLAQMRTEDLRELDARREASRTALRQATLTLRSGVALSIALLLCLVYYRRRDDARLRTADQIAERALHASEERYRLLTQSINDIFVAMNHEMRFTFWNAAAERLTGVSADAALGKTRAELLGQTQAVRLAEERCRECLANGQPLAYELEFSHQGKTYWLDVRVQPTADGVTEIARDITERKLAEEQCRRVLHELETVLDVAPVAIWIAHDSECRRITGNRFANELLGSAPHANVSPSVKAEQPVAAHRVFQNGRELAVSQMPAQVAARTGQPVLRQEVVLQRAGGRARDLLMSSLPLFDAQARMRGSVTVGVDITDQKRTEEQLRERERQFVGLANAIPNLAWTEEPDGTHQYFNRGWYEYTGLSEQQSKQADAWAAVLHPEDEPRVEAQRRESLRRGIPFESEFRLRRHDGVYRWFLARSSADRGSDGEVVQWFGTCTDIDGTKAIEETLRQTESALREADTRKDVFLATLSHELRNSLAPVGAAARLLESPGLGSLETARSGSMISRQVTQMASLLDDLLDISKISRGTLALRKKALDVREILRSAVEIAQPLIDARQHHLSVEWPAAQVVLEGDALRLTQVVANLLTNAAKYTESGGRIMLGVRSEESRCVIVVRDTGVGLAPEMLNRVFDLYTQAAPHEERSQGGLGIGLALARGLVELHGGRIEARSPGRDMGSEFMVSLPLSSTVADIVTPAYAIPNGQPNRHTRRRVLIADDNRDGAESLALLLQLSGHEVHVVHTGVESLDVASRLRPEIAILDIGMPGLNGYEVARRIRRERWSAHMMLIAVTGWGQPDDKREALAAGFDHHLTKPVDPEALERLFASAPGALRRNA